MHKLLKASALCAGLCFLSAAATATPILDPAGDFLSTLDPAAPRAGDLDVLSAETFLDGEAFLFTATMGAPIGTTDLAFNVGASIAAPVQRRNSFGGVGLTILIFDGGTSRRTTEPLSSSSSRRQVRRARPRCWHRAA